MNYWKVILATVVIFGAGVLTGDLLVNHVVHSHQKSPHHPSVNNPARAQASGPATPAPLEFSMPRPAREMRKQFVQQINESLNLTPEQRVKIEKIIAEGQERNREIWTNAAPKMRLVIQDVNLQIRAELTPEQLRPFEELLKHPPRRSPNGTNGSLSTAPR